MLTFCNLYSGSGGNATYIGTEKDAVLVDCGMSGKMIEQALAAARLDPARIRAILITHEHSDHIKGVGVLSRRWGVPVAATPATLAAMEKCLEGVPDARRLALDAGESFFVGSLECVSFAAPHDAAGPVGYRVFSRDGSAACATDMGYFSAEAEAALCGANVVLLESNHDPDLLQANPNYPASLKTRILGRKGHLSNEAGAAAAVKLLASGTQHLLLGHLSRENNRPRLAYTTAGEALAKTGAREGEDFTLHVASQDGPVRVYQIGAEG